VGNVNPTQIRSAYRPRISRDHLIIAGAVILAATLIIVSWVATRGGPGGLTGQVMILSVPPGASVILDGVMVGHTPYNVKSLPVGKHTMTLEHGGFETESRVIDVVPNEMLPVQLVLKPNAAAPAGAAAETLGSRK
jgi:hypothetical protein